MPRISEFYGIAVYIYYRDHNPPHFHAIYDEAEAVIEIRTAAILEGSLPRRAAKLVAEWCDLHRADLLADWALARSPATALAYRTTGLIPMILHITEAELVGPTSLFLRFNDGCVATVDLRSLLTGPIFEPLLEPDMFARFTVDPVCKTICWPNGADLAPEAVRAMVPTKQEIVG